MACERPQCTILLSILFAQTAHNDLWRSHIFFCTLSIKRTKMVGHGSLYSESGTLDSLLVNMDVDVVPGDNDVRSLLDTQEGLKKQIICNRLAILTIKCLIRDPSRGVRFTGMLNDGTESFLTHPFMNGCERMPVLPF